MNDRSREQERRQGPAAAADRSGALRAAPDVDLAAIESRWYRVRALRMHARVGAASVPAGRPPVILVHGLVVSSRYMRPLIQHLGRHFPVLAPDLPGFGWSDKPRRVLSLAELAEALGAWMAAAGLERAALLGNSLGCQIAVELARRQPERVPALVLQGLTIDPKGRTFWQTFVRNLMKMRLEGGVGLGPILDHLQAGPRRAALTTRHMLNHPIEDKLPQVTQPALVVRGARDPIVPQRWAEETARRLPAGRLLVIPGAAHTMVTTHPLELTRVARPFLIEAAAAPPAKAGRETDRALADAR
jgi:2-hydroxy-6-oxonona-2,4-dienedioate hydrolase